MNKFQNVFGLNLQGSSIKDRIAMIFFSTSFDATSFQDASVQSSNRTFFNLKKIRRFLRKSIYLPFIIVLLLFILIGALVIKGASSKSPTSPQTTTTSDGRIALKAPVAQQNLNRSFDFPLRDSTGKQISTLRYEIKNVDLRTEIIINGQKATALEGRDFLVINLAITNSYNRSVKVNARDYLRLTVNTSSVKLAPDIHNDPVEVQPISTKFTRVAFPINDTDKNLVLQVGEIAGTKTTVKLNLK